MEDRPGRVQVAVRLLGRSDLGDQLIDLPLQSGVGMRFKAGGRALEDLVHVRIVERVAAVKQAFRGGARQEAGGGFKIADAARLFALLESIRDGHPAVCFQAPRPDGVGQLDPVEGHGLKRVIRLQGLQELDLVDQSRPRRQDEALLAAALSAVIASAAVGQ